MKKIILILITLILIINLSGCIFTNQDNNEKNHYTYKYTIEIKTTNNKAYEIYVPIVINDNDKNISQIMTQLDVIGSCNHFINNTNYGDALKINGNGDVTIKSEGDGKIPFGFLNLMDNNNNGIRENESGRIDYWLYIHDNNSSIESIRVSCYIDHYTNNSSKGSHSFLFFHDSNERGWIKIEGTIGFEHGE